MVEDGGGHAGFLLDVCLMGHCLVPLFDLTRFGWGGYQDRRRPGRIRQDRSEAGECAADRKIGPARNGPKGQGNFPGSGALLPGRGALSPDPPVHRTPYPNGIRLNPRNLCPVGHPRGGWRSPRPRTPDLVAFMAPSRDRRSASLPNARRSSLKSPMFGTRSTQAILAIPVGYAISLMRYGQLRHCPARSR